MTLAFGKHSAKVECLFSSASGNNDSSFNSDNVSLFIDGNKDYNNTDERTNTFILWPKWARVPASELAFAGFHYSGTSDLVRCHGCHMEHSGWVRTDDPLDMHLRHRPVCMIARGISAAYASEIHAERRTTSSHSPQITRSRSGLHANDRTWSSLPASLENSMQSDIYGNTDTEPVIVPRQSPRMPSRNPSLDMAKLSNEENRLLSFINKWSEDYPVQPKDLAKAGFFYKGPKDRVQCAFCKGIVCKWVPGDSALGEHARHFPSCPFVAEISSKTTTILELPAAQVMLNMGYSEALVTKTIKQLNEKGIETPTTDQMVDILFDMSGDEEEVTSSQRKFHQDTESGQKPGDEKSSELIHLQQENEDLKHSALCKVCLMNKVEMLSLPCRHLVSCAGCTHKLDFCPVCRVRIVGTVKTYMA